MMGKYEREGISVSIVGENLKRYMREHNIANPHQLEILTGKDQSYLTRLMEGDHNPISKTVEEIAAKLNLELEYFYKRIPEEEKKPITQNPKKDNINPMEVVNDIKSIIDRYPNGELKYLGTTVMIPIYGHIPAGTPCVTSENREGFVIVLRQLLDQYGSGVFFALKVQGNSLQGDGLKSGDQILVKKLHEVDIEGKIYICRLISGCVAKHVKFFSDKIRLWSTNSAYEDLEPESCEIVGRVVMKVPEPEEL